MARATYPRVFWDESTGSYRAEMVDKKTGQVWGSGHGETRQAAIKTAAVDQPSSAAIKKAVGWVARHPFIAGAAVGTYLAYRHAKRHQAEMRPIDYISIGAIAGTLAWGLSKLFGLSEFASERGY